jgi:ribosomal protein S18 acetylase RimI-like enzyme
MFISFALKSGLHRTIFPAPVMEEIGKKMALVLSVLTVDAFINLLPGVAEVYTQAFSGPPYNKPRVELESFFEEAREHAERLDFRACAAVEPGLEIPAGRLVGFTYGYRLLPKYWWYQQIEPHLARQGQAAWLRDAFELTQMAVLPEFQGQGIGGQLHDLLLQDLPYRHGLLSTLNEETNATALYRRRGWQVLLEPFQFAGVNRPYRIMGREF